MCLVVTGHGRKRLVEESPNTTGAYKQAYVMRMTWQKLYNCHYLPYCVKRNFKPVSPTKFCAIRSQHRPLYRRCRKVSLFWWWSVDAFSLLMLAMCTAGVQDLMEPHRVLAVRAAADGCGQSQEQGCQEEVRARAAGPLGAPSWVPRQLRARHHQGKLKYIVIQLLIATLSPSNF